MVACTKTYAGGTRRQRNLIMTRREQREDAVNETKVTLESRRVLSIFRLGNYGHHRQPTNSSSKRRHKQTARSRRANLTTFNLLFALWPSCAECKPGSLGTLPYWFNRGKEGWLEFGQPIRFFLYIYMMESIYLLYEAYISSH